MKHIHDILSGYGLTVPEDRRTADPATPGAGGRVWGEAGRGGAGDGKPVL